MSGNDPIADVVDIALSKQRRAIVAALMALADEDPDGIDPAWRAGVRAAAKHVERGSRR